MEPDENGKHCIISYKMQITEENINLDGDKEDKTFDKDITIDFNEIVQLNNLSISVTLLD